MYVLIALKIKIIQLDNQLCSLTRFLVFACSHQNIYLIKNQKETELNEQSELEYLKTPSQMSSYAH